MQHAAPAPNMGHSTGRSEAMGMQWKTGLMASALALALGGVACAPDDGGRDDARTPGEATEASVQPQADGSATPGVDPATGEVDSAREAAATAPDVEPPAGGEHDNLRQTAASLFGVIPEAPTEVSGRTVTPERVELGRMLF